MKDTDILKPEAFREQVLLAGEKDEKGVAEYCVAELLYSGPMAQAAEAAGRVFRATDCLGTDGNGRLFALLNNTGPQSLEYLRERLELCGMEVRLAEDEQAASDEAADVPLTV